MQELVKIDRIEHQFQETVFFKPCCVKKSLQKSDLNVKVEMQPFPSLSTINLQNIIPFHLEVKEIIFT